MKPEFQQSALLIMDMQAGIVRNLPNASIHLAKATEAIATARQLHIPIIYVVVGFRDGMPEISTHNKGFSSLRERLTGADMSQFMAVVPELAPQDGDVVVTKRRISAFTGSDLEVVLRAKQLRHLVLTGFSTSGVVLSTLREAADKDYELTVLHDCCADGDEEVHRVLTTKIFPRQATVMGTEEWKRGLWGH